MATEDSNKQKCSTKFETTKYEDPNDPPYLHHSDQPGAILVTHPLNDENYSTWSRAMTMALNAKNKEGLLNFVSKDIGASVIYNNVAYDIWNELNERFSHTNNVHLFHIEQEIHESVQGNMNIGAYFTILKSFWDDHDALCSFPTCACGAVKELMQFQRSQKTMIFLMSLNEHYVAVREQILLMDPLSAINKAFLLIIQDEKQKAVSTHAPGRSSITDAAAFAVWDNMRNSGRNFSPKNPLLKCDRCDATRHTSDICRAHLKCDYYNWRGHTID
ncbi:uncharacterized protein LOC103965159 [Pyrus x bretschneideri]|uniref:uncharacterized protein LOC103965159 n=1 Tax=Pyrus x bretschneideri TaxID=225117 RepID=UPI00202F6D20|nr:uncharacterized protein LOC103965159 [Pyrus x bretschneideri]